MCISLCVWRWSQLVEERLEGGVGKKETYSAKWLTKKKNCERWVWNRLVVLQITVGSLTGAVCLYIATCNKQIVSFRNWTNSIQWFIYSSCYTFDRFYTIHRLTKKAGEYKNTAHGINYLSSQWLTETEATIQTLYKFYLCPLPICYGCIAWRSSGIPKSGSGSISDDYVCFWNPGLPSPALIWRIVPSIIVICYAMFGWYPREACSIFL